METIYHNLVEHFGGQVAAAKALDVSQSNISGYTSGRWSMSVKVAIKAEKATNGEFKAVDLCPALKDLKNLSA